MIYFIVLLLASGVPVLSLTIMLASFLPAQPVAAEGIPLWKGKAPHAVGDSDTDKPSITAYRALPEKANGAGVIVCPGGGYGFLANDHEGKQVAQFFNELGVTAFVLKYRIATKDRPSPIHPAPLADAQRAIRYARANAKEYGLDVKRIGIIGFSAGGHLASTAGTHFDAGDATSADAIERMSCRPDFLILGYPVISMELGTTHGGSRNNLIGPKPTTELVESLSNDKQVTKDTPATFLFHTTNDSAVLPENATRFYLACKAARVPVEMHIYEKGPHGVGMNPKDVSVGVDAWKNRLADWLKDQAILGKK